MRTTLVLSLSCLFALPALWQSPQDPEPPTHAPPSKRTSDDFSKLLKSMEGCWQLMDVRIPGAQTGNRLEVAYLLIAQEFMSIEFHMGFFSTEEQMLESYFQSGTYRLSTDHGGNLITTTLIGSFFDDEERLIFEPPGTKRSYTVQVDHDRLTLVRLSDAARYGFEKLRSSSDSDFYGRARPKEKAEEAEQEQDEPRRRRER